MESVKRNRSDRLGKLGRISVGLSCGAGIFALLLLVLVAILFWRKLSPQKESRPNVILISLDTLRADHIHGYGYGPETTPVIDDLMRRSLSFSNAISSSPWTLPSHVSIFTSLYPHSHGVMKLSLALNEEVPTLPVLLKQAGYTNMAVTTVSGLSSRYGLGRGFDTYVCHDGLRATGAFEQALRLLTHVQSENFFLFLHLYDVHSDYDPLDNYLDLFETSYDGEIDGTSETLKKIRSGNLEISKEDLRHLVALYDAGIRQLDSQLGTFLRMLEQKGILSNTVLIVVSDHGEEFLDHGSVLHGRTLFDEMIRAALIISGPGIPAGKTVDEQVQLIDIMPTILELCRVEIPRGVQGSSLVPLIKGENIEWNRSAFAEVDLTGANLGMRSVLRTDNYKLYHNTLTGQYELYDIVLDPAEQQNIADKKPDVVASLEKELRKKMATKRGSPVTVELNEKDKERLRALGYLN